MFEITITDEAFPYLVIQRGKINGLHADRQVWTQAYIESLNNDFDLIVDYLPENCESILDVGGGLGGIDILLSRHFETNPKITILDGENNFPRIESHSTTFNNFTVSRNFLNANNVFNFHPISSKNPDNITEKYDLIISFQAWCFHFSPVEYLNTIIRACKNDTKIIVDVRKNDYYMDILLENFTLQDTILDAEKFTRVVFTYDN